MSAHAQNFHPAEQELAHKIVAVTGGGTAGLDVINRSSLVPLEVEHIRDSLRSVLLTEGLQVVPPGASATSVRLSLSENLQGYVWVAQIQHGTEPPALVMLNVSRAPVVTGIGPTSHVSIRKTLLWSQEDRILDLAVMDEKTAVMVVLSPGQVTALILRNAAWQMEGSASIPYSHPWPRDLRGHLVALGKEKISAYLPGLVCDIAVSKSVVSTCRESNQAWPLSSSAFKIAGFFAPTRNFFTALSTADGQQMNASQFYSASPIRPSVGSDWVIAATDGKVHLVSGVRDQVLDGLAWGSDIAGVQSQCGTKWQVLATGRSSSDSDSVQAFEVLGGIAVPVSNPVDFRGRIAALWSNWDASSAVAIVEGGEKGDYEAYRLSVDCSD